MILAAQTYGLPTDEWLLPQALKEASYYTSIVGKWGHPAMTRSRPAKANKGAAAEVFFLFYPDQGYTLVLSGAEREQASYLGAINSSGRFRPASGYR